MADHSKERIAAIRARISEIDDAQEAAPCWGAAVSVRHEERQGLVRELAMLEHDAFPAVRA